MPWLASRKASQEPLLTSHPESEASGTYEYIFAVRLPSAVKASEREAFARYVGSSNGKAAKFYKRKSFVQAHNAKVEKCPVSDFLVEHLFRVRTINSVAIDAQQGTELNLEDTLNVFIGVLLSFFESLASSNNASIEVLKFVSVEKNKIFICVGTSDKLANIMADMVEYPVQLSARALDYLGIQISDQTGLVPAFVKCDQWLIDKDLLNTREDSERPGKPVILKGIDRIRLMYDKIESHLRIERLQQVLEPMNVTLKVFPAPSQRALEDLQKQWASWRLLLSVSQPIDQIRDYFGEAIAFHFLFIQTVQQGMLVLGIVSVVCLIVGMLSSRMLSTCLFGTATLVWSPAMIKIWRRREAAYANKWGTDFENLNSEMKRVVNPHFGGDLVPAHYDENVRMLQPESYARQRGYFVSVAGSTAFMIFVFACVMANRTWAEFEIISNSKTPIATPILALQVFVFNKIWSLFLGPWLTHCEQHPFQDEWDRSMTVKTFVFNFFNQFNAFYWLAFVQPTWHPFGQLKTDAKSEEEDLRQSVRVAFLTLMVFTSLDLLTPFCYTLYKFNKQRRDLKKLGSDQYAIGALEGQTKLQPWTGEAEAESYLRVINPLAFVLLFGISAPFEVWMLAYVSICLSLRITAKRLVALHQRPYPRWAGGIGVWNYILVFLLLCSIFTTLGMVVMNATLNMKEKVLGFDGSVTFFLVQNVAIGGLFIVHWAIPDQTPHTLRERRRQAHQRIRLYEAENNEFTEKINVSGTCDWKDSKYHLNKQLVHERSFYDSLITSLRR